MAITYQLINYYEYYDLFIFFSLFEEKFISVERIKQNFDVEKEKINETKNIVTDINQNN